MSATTPPKREPAHHSGGGRISETRPYTFWLLGGLIFLAAWLVWTFWFSSSIPA